MPIKIHQLNYVYQLGTPLARQALFNLDLAIREGELVGIIGRTGSGKSTLIQHLNGLLKPTSGTVVVDEFVLTGTKRDRNLSYRELRQRVGVVFQYPEQQLFEETVFDDIAFGPRNLGLTPDVVERRVQQALEMVGLEPAEIGSRSPLQLSGGQMRRVALAGVLAMHPQKIVLDEPTAGLDPGSRESILDQIVVLNRRWRLTVIIVSHQMEEVARLADRLFVLDQGRVVLQGTPAEVFGAPEKVAELGLELPVTACLLHQLQGQGWPVRTDIFEPEAVVAEIVRVLGLPFGGGEG
ncbi:MAG: energy-coupling factor transporter ATPase [Heliobacteriaceae bacterium]|nr:energy-coupling factor transporter ATPase [Heliobacteriaceae bacterium]MDD4587994.1 energy-coupling factor transporter ATPase [Heliobacteriaceae bacterium]